MAGMMDTEDISWQEFEEKIREILEIHGFETKFRVVFKFRGGKSEIDVLASRFGINLAIDAKRYSAKRYRVSGVKREAGKHYERCRKFEEVTGVSVVPIVVPLIDDAVFFHSGCIIVPFEKFNDFLVNIHAYLEEFGFGDFISQES